MYYNLITLASNMKNLDGVDNTYVHLNYLGPFKIPNIECPAFWTE